MEITGRTVFAITASFFAVIIGVNLVLAWQAVATFPGLEVKNSYVASQTFDAERTAQEALGWKVAVEESGGVLLLSITDREGRPVQPAEMTATVGRTTHVADDVTPAFAFTGTGYRATADLGPGRWDLRLEARAADGTLFRQRLPVHVIR
jgi:nitrogen fixation protein FixH